MRTRRTVFQVLAHDRELRFAQLPIEVFINLVVRLFAIHAPLHGFNLPWPWRCRPPAPGPIVNAGGAGAHETISTSPFREVFQEFQRSPCMRILRRRRAEQPSEIPSEAPRSLLGLILRRACRARA